MPNNKNNAKLLNPAQKQAITDLCQNYTVPEKVAARNCRFVVFGSENRRLVVMISPMGGLLDATIRNKGETDLF